MSKPPHVQSHSGTYDVIGRGCVGNRVPDPHITACVREALADAKRICNIGAGAGARTNRAIAK